MDTDEPRIVVLTGATRGLGRAMVDEFVARGHIVYGCGTRVELIAALQATYGRQYFSVVDVTIPEEVKIWAAEVLRDAGRAPDLLVNNAAVVNRNAPLWEVPVEEFGHVVDVNLKGVHNVIHYFVPAMVARRSGTIVNFSSTWGRSTSPHVAPYCASKFGIEGLTKALAQELPSPMTAVPLNPGIIDTDMLRISFDTSAGDYIRPAEWATRAVPLILSFSRGSNGKSMSAEC